MQRQRQERIRRGREIDVADKPSDLDGSEKPKKSWLRRVAEKGWQNYEDTVSGMNKGLNQGLMRLDQEHRASGISMDLPVAGTTRAVGSAGPRIWKSAAAAPGEGGLVREGGGIWKKLQRALGSGAPDDEVAKAANNYAELWDSGKKTDDLVR